MFDMLSSDFRTARFMTLPTRYVAAAETGTRIKVRQVSRQLNQNAPARQVTIRNGSRTTLLINVLRPCESDSMSLVNRDINSAVPLSEKRARSSASVRR